MIFWQVVLMNRLPVISDPKMARALMMERGIPDSIT
jgi:hypothetical protein